MIPARLLPLLLLASPAAAFADTPSFDRPGISFSTATLPPGTFDVEQGLPDFATDASDGARATLYSAGTVVRAGLASNLELQVSTALFNRLRQSDASGSQTSNGAGDTGVALKVAVPTGVAPLTLAILGGMTLATGDDDFSNGKPGYSLGATASWALTDTRALAFYANVDRSDGANAYTVSPLLGFTLSDTLGVFVEAGATHAQGVNDYVGGGGVTLLVLNNVQLDAYADAGLTARSTDLQAGIGVSAFFQ